MTSDASAPGAPTALLARLRQAAARTLASRAALAAFRLLLGGVFIWASVDKILHPAGFAKAIHDYRILPIALVNLAAITLPWVEALAGVLLIAGIWVRAGALVLSVLLGVFLIAIAAALARGLDITCGCFSVSAEGARIAWDLLVRDVALLAVGVHLVRVPPGRTNQ